MNEWVVGFVTSSNDLTEGNFGCSLSCFLTILTNPVKFRREKLSSSCVSLKASS